MFSPLGFPEPLGEPLEEEERISFILLQVLSSLGHRGAILGSLSSESPHPRTTALGTHFPVMRTIAVPLLTVVSQSGEQTPPRHTQGF